MKETLRSLESQSRLLKNNNELLKEENIRKQAMLNEQQSLFLQKE